MKIKAFEVFPIIQWKIEGREVFAFSSGKIYLGVDFDCFILPRIMLGCRNFTPLFVWHMQCSRLF